MQKKMARVADALGLVARGALGVSAACLVLMTALVAWQVFTRYVLDSPSVWTEQVAILLMGWFIFLGAAVGAREGYHLSFDVLLHVLPARIGRALNTLSDLAVGAFGAGMLWYGLELALGTWGSAMPTLGLPSGFALLPVALAGLMIVLFSAERVARRAAGLATARFGDQPAEG